MILGAYLCSKDLVDSCTPHIGSEEKPFDNMKHPFLKKKKLSLYSILYCFCCEPAIERNVHNSEYGPLPPENKPAVLIRDCN